MTDLGINPPRVYCTSYQELACIGTALGGTRFTVERKGLGCWEQVKNDPGGNEIIRAQITLSRPINHGELCIYEQYCPGGIFHDRFRSANRDDFKDEIE